MKRIVMIVMAVLIGLLVCGATSRCKVSKVKFPASTELCGIRLTDTMKSVWVKYGQGPTYQGRPQPVEYQDPNEGVTLFVDISRDGRVHGLHLRYDRNPTAIRARRSFVKLGHRGIILGSSKAQVAKVYGSFKTNVGSDIDMDGDEIVHFKVNSPQKTPCQIYLVFDKGKVTEIFSGYLP